MPAAPSPLPEPAAAPPARRRSAVRTGAWFVLVLWVLFLVGGYAALALSGRSLPLPVWVLAEAEERLNDRLSPTLGGALLALDGAEIAIDDGWVPRLQVRDLRVIDPGGATLLALPDASLTLDPAAMWEGSVRLRRVTASGAQVQITRFEDGRFNFSFGQGAQMPRIDSLAGLFAALDRALALPALAALEGVEADALAVTLDDRRVGRIWQIGDGRFILANGAAGIGAELAFSLQQPGQNPATARLTATLARGTSRARLSATVTDVAARDLAAQSSPLAWAQVLDAPVSGEVSAVLHTSGLTAFEGQLTIGEGALRPNAATTPVRFDGAQLRLGYDAATGRIALDDLAVQSDSLRVEAQGQAFLLDGAGQRMSGPLAGRVPAAFLGQIGVSKLMVDPAGLFEAPVTFSGGSIDLRLSLSPFRLDVGQFRLSEGDQTISARGTLRADEDGWRLALDAGINRIGVDRLMALWPLRLVPRTRDWLVANVEVGELFNLRAALRLAPETQPVISMDYEFRDTAVRFIRTLPPITGAFGRAGIKDRTYTMVVDRGQVMPPAGGPITVRSGTFTIADITEKPAHAVIEMDTESSITAALAVLDEPPFQFMTKAGKPVDLAEGRAEVSSRMSLPLKQGLQPNEVRFDVTGRLSEVSSTKLVEGKTIGADLLELRADSTGMTIRGPGRIGAVPFDMTYTQGFGPPGTAARPRITGTAELSQAAVTEFALDFPPGTVSGRGTAEVTLDFPAGAPIRLALQSDLRGVGLSVPAIGWTKPAGQSGRLEADVVLSRPARVDRLALSGGGLEVAEGEVTLRADGGLERARLGKVALNGWIDGAPVTLVGQGRGKPPAVEVDGGTVRLARLSGAGLGGGGGSGGANVPVTLRLDRLEVSRGLVLTGLRGQFDTRGGFNGDFVAAVNGGPRVQGTVVPSRQGTAARIRADDAGAVLQAAGIFDSARGGDLDLVLTPTGGAGEYDGTVRLNSFRVLNDNILADLLNAISVVGLLEQFQGAGIAFASAEAKLTLSPEKVVIRDGAATGASIGVSLSGSYRLADSRLDMEGVISPIYMVNGIGQVLTRRGEGLLGFNYNLRGAADDPQVSVNPLSILTPGMFRNIFRLGQGTGPGG